MLIKVIYVLVALFILGIIVMVHEVGHFVAGRLCGIGVVEFSVGFGPKVFGWKRKDILYSIRAIPMGGYCKFVGEDEVNASPNAMNLQPVWKRFVTILAGPVMNFVLAYITVVFLLANYSVAGIFPVIDSVQSDMPAQEAGLEAGDIITSVNGTEVTYDTDGIEVIRNVISSSDLITPITLGIERDGQPMELSIVPTRVETETTDSETGETVPSTAIQIGIVFGSRTYTVGESIRYSTTYMIDVTKQMLLTIKNLVFKGEGLKEVSGPVGIISYVSKQVNEGMGMILQIIFVISLNLGIMNLLPLPALDGGRLVFLAVEAVRRKPVPADKEGMVHAIGFLLLIGLILVVTYRDIAKLITG